MLLRRLAPVAFAVALAGCGSFGAIGLGPMGGRNEAPRAQSDTLPPVASAKVESAPLAPPPGVSASAEPGSMTTIDPNNTTAAGQASGAGAPTQTAAAGTGPAIGRTDLLGGWTISSGSDSCQLFMTLTSWTGGYRASTRGCQSATLKSISAWSLSGSQVVLSGTGGSPVARLSSSGGNRFDGHTEGQATPVSFYR